METITNSFIYSGLALGCISFCLWLYEKAYAKGYEIGKHCGFTEGLYRAHCRASSKKESSLY